MRSEAHFKATYMIIVIKLYMYKVYIVMNYFTFQKFSFGLNMSLIMVLKNQFNAIGNLYIFKSTCRQLIE